jgi:hypothetical protein
MKLHSRETKDHLSRGVAQKIIKPRWNVLEVEEEEGEEEEVKRSLCLVSWHVPEVQKSRVGYSRLD